MAQTRIIGTPSNDEIWNALNRNVGMLGQIHRSEKLRKIGVQEKETLRKRTLQDSIKKMIIGKVISGKGEYGGDFSQVLGGGQMDYDQYNPISSQMQSSQISPSAYGVLQQGAEKDAIENVLGDPAMVNMGTPLPPEAVRGIDEYRIRMMIEKEMKPYKEQFKSQYLPKVFKGKTKKTVTGKVIVEKNEKQFSLPRSQIKEAIKQGYTLVQ